jgi:predicted phage terminase large subunit-like protein
MSQPKHRALGLARDDLGCYGAALDSRFELARHHKLLVQQLERVESGLFDRLMIFMPPRHGKSLITSTLFPAWYLGRHPEHSIIAASYGAELATDFGRRVRNFVADPLHRAIFPTCVLAGDSSAVHRFNLEAGGAYYSVGAGGPITGRGANILLIDDAVKNREEAFSQTARRSLQAWYETTAYTRLAPGGSIIVIATRWHVEDLPGWLLKEHASEGWKVINLAALAEPDDALGRKEGEPLWPERFPAEVLERIKEAIGTSAWQSLYQQRPVAETGGIFQKDWWRSYKDAPECRRIVFSADTAFKTGQSNDYSVIQVWGEAAAGYHLLHVWRQRAEFPELKRQAIALAEIWKPNAVLVEDMASGQSLIQSLQAETRLPILPVKPLGDKVARASAVSPIVESGRVYLPESAAWLGDFLDEVSSFPAAPHDDQVDALSQALNYLRGSGSYVDIDFQQRAAAVFHEQTLLREEHIDVVSGSHSSAAGFGWAKAEDRAEAMAKSSSRWRWRGF